MKKSAIVIATLIALSTGTASANTEVLNGFTGKIEAEYTTQDKHANVETQLGYDFNFGAVSVIPFFSAETAYSGKCARYCTAINNALLGVNQQCKC